MKKVQYNKIADNKTNQSSINSNNGSNTLFSILLHRLELMGLFKSFMVRTSLRRCSSMMRSHFAFQSFSTVSLALVSVLALALTFSFSFFSYLIMPSNASAASNLTVTVTNTISLDIVPNSASGTFAHSSTSANTVTVMTDNYTGYTLGIAASTANDNALSYKVNDAVVDTIASHTNTSGVSESNYANDSYASSNSLNNTWGYRPSTYYDTANNTNVDNTSTNLYFPAPTSTSVNTLAKTTTANPSTADNYNIAIGARVGIDKTPGAYTNTLVLTVVANPTPYTITYNANGGSNGPANENASTYASTVNISSTVPTKTNYTFLGWCAGTSSSSNITTTAGVDSCSTTVYNPNGGGTNLDLAIDQTASSNDNYLYAMWSLNSYTVTVNFAGSGVSSVSFANSTYGNATTVSTSGGTTSLKHGVSYTITMNFSSSSYAINSWATTANGTLASTTANPTTYTVTNTATLTATGKSSGYTITFIPNGGSGSNYTQTISGTDYLSGNNFTRSNYYFKGWSTSSGTSNTVTYRAGQSITPTANMTLYAVWGSSTSTTLYDIVASLNYSRTLDNTTTNGTGLSAKAGIKAFTITKDSSGVFTYNPTTFGTPSDVATTSTIYLYRGILDSNLDGTSSTYGSNGNSANYPNYVKLGNTCWRIVRTTGSGGVKMIYNGLYSSGTTANSCANAQTNAQVTTQAFGLKGNSAQSTWYYNINRVGYTFNNSSDIQDNTNATPVDTVFGSDANPATNNERSNIKKYIEDTWYTSANGISAYTSILEASAGYCNDRTAYSNANTSTALETIPPYRTSSSGQTMYFGAYGRNMNSAKTPSLTCPRSTVDLYRYVANSTGVSNELKYPVALLTADEASFAGSGSSATNGSAYNYNSFLRSGSAFWLLSPYYRTSIGNAYEFRLALNGYLNDDNVNTAYGVRPAISLTSGTTATSGSGTATSPWVITAP